MASAFAKVILYLSQENNSALCVTACPAASEMLLWTRFPRGHNGLSGSMLLFLALHCFFLMCLLPQKENALVKVADIALGS